MICILCSSPLSVSNSRPQRSRNQVWRRRSCPGCGAIYTSEERLNLSKSVSVIGSSGARQPFSHSKLLISLYNACRHRPTAAEDAAGLADTVTARLLPAITHTTLAASSIVAITYDVLKRFDRAAAVQYQAFHPVKH